MTNRMTLLLSLLKREIKRVSDPVVLDIPGFFQPNFNDLEKKEKGLNQNSITSPDQLWVSSRKKKLHFSGPNKR